MAIAAAAIPAIAPIIRSSKFDLAELSVLSMPTTMGVPVKAEAEIVPDTMLSWLNIVEIETQPFPFQYSITLAFVKFGFEMVTFA